ncbi:MAG: RIP metalloprotease RseP [Rhodospirillales bacterium]|nr:RIP metalloprotease RseP [Rhodospirillales bacterium]
MELFGFVWDNIVPFLFVLTVLVFVHELGHFWVARKCGVRVQVFSVGFGPEIYGRNDRHGTRWKIGAIPLGGYVKMYGEGDTEESEDGTERELTDEERRVSFVHKPLIQRSAIVAAGPAANFLLAILLFSILLGVVGSPRLLPYVGGIEAGSAAEQAGLEIGDRIVEGNGQPILSFDDLRRFIGENPGRQVGLIVRRGETELDLSVTPGIQSNTLSDGSVQERGLLGVTADPAQVDYIRHDPLTAVWKSVETTYSMTVRILAYLGEIIVGSRPADEVGGPIRIAQMSAEVAQGGLVNLINFMAVLSINLALINLFPIPMLDGGHLVFFLAEAIRGRPLTPRVQEYGFRFGLILVFLLMIFATWNDLVHHIKVFEVLKGLVT